MRMLRSSGRRVKDCEGTSQVVNPLFDETDTGDDEGDDDNDDCDERYAFFSYSSR